MADVCGEAATERRLESKSGVEVTPQMARKLLEAVVGRMRDVLTRGGSGQEIAVARLTEAQGWGLEDVEDLESCLPAVDENDLFLRSLLNLYKDFSARAVPASSRTTASKEEDPLPDTSASCTAAEKEPAAEALEVTASGKPADEHRKEGEQLASQTDSETERLRKLSLWHKDAPDPVVAGSKATWAIVRWEDTRLCSKRGEGVWSEEFECAGKRGLRLGVFPSGRSEAVDGAVAVFLTARVGAQFKASVELGGVSRAKNMTFKSANGGAPPLAGWQLFCTAAELRVAEDGSMPVVFEVK